MFVDRDLYAPGVPGDDGIDKLLVRLNADVQPLGGRFGGGSVSSGHSVLAHEPCHRQVERRRRLVRGDERNAFVQVPVRQQERGRTLGCR